MTENFLNEGIVIAGVALIPLISVVISVLKAWLKLEGKQIALANVILGLIAVILYGVIEGGLTPLSAIISAFSLAFGSKLFHDTFGHAVNVITDFFGKKS